MILPVHYSIKWFNKAKLISNFVDNNSAIKVNFRTAARTIKRTSAQGGPWCIEIFCINKVTILEQHNWKISNVSDPAQWSLRYFYPC